MYQYRPVMPVSLLRGMPQPQEAPQQAITFIIAMMTSGGPIIPTGLTSSHTGTDRTLTQTVVNARSYQYRVRAYNTAGSGPWSDSTPSSGIIPVAALPVPGKVGRGTVSVGDTTATVYWSAPSGGGTATDYDVQYRSDASGGTSYGGWADHSHVGTALNATLTGLTNLYRYQFRVRGGNATGEGAWSDPMPPDGVVPKIPVPGKVSLVSTTAGNTTVDISWPAPTGIVTDYDVQHRFLVQSGFSVWTDKAHTGTARTSTVSRLTNGVKYQFRVRGGNSTGEGPWSDPFPSGGVIPKTARTRKGVWRYEQRLGTLLLIFRGMLPQVR